MSWGVYIAAALVLVGAISPTLQVVSSGTAATSGRSLVAGIASVLDSLRPGLTTILVFQPTAQNSSVSLGGQTVSTNVYGMTFTARCFWPLPIVNLFPGVLYSLRLSEGRVLVS
ncbi:MAG TPA: hypothetical protein VEJ36_05120 [Nitrososphaerales archaeon]|nr:hypothetical protein [Nitrososphaerales archaeon]